MGRDPLLMAAVGWGLITTCMLLTGYGGGDSVALLESLRAQHDSQLSRLQSSLHDLEQEVKANRLEAANDVKDLDARVSAAEITTASTQLSGRSGKGTVAADGGGISS
eukprot:COSAG05_NODE_9524_length_618_cov_1.117534_1_plen_107_part_10